MPPETLSKHQQALLDTINQPGVYINKDGIIVGKGNHRKADPRTLDALHRRRLVRKQRNGVWNVTPAGKKSAKPITGKAVSSKAPESIRGKNGIGKRGPLPGHGGKPKGAVRERTWNARDLMLQLEAELGRPVDPLEGMVRIAYKFEDAEQYSSAFDVWKALAQYQYPKLSSVEHSGVADSPIQHAHKVDVRLLSDAELKELYRLRKKMEGAEDAK